MTLIRWEPFRELDHLFASYRPLIGRPDAQSWTPVTNVSETDSEYLIKAELPEVEKDDVKVTVDEGVITITGERRKEAEHKDERVHRIESLYGSFSRSFRLPEDAEVEAIKAESRNGVLKLRVPKKPTARPRTVEVQVN